MGMELGKVLTNNASWQTKSPRQLKGDISLLRKLSKFLGAPSERAIAKAKNVGDLKKDIHTKKYEGDRINEIGFEASCVAMGGPIGLMVVSALHADSASKAIESIRP